MMANEREYLVTQIWVVESFDGEEWSNERGDIIFDNYQAAIDAFEEIKQSQPNRKPDTLRIIQVVGHAIEYN